MEIHREQIIPARKIPAVNMTNINLKDLEVDEEPILGEMEMLP